MDYTGYKVYLNRRILYLDASGDIFYQGETWSATHSGQSYLEANSTIYGDGINGPVYSSYFPPIVSGSTAYGDNFSCP